MWLAALAALAVIGSSVAAQPSAARPPVGTFSGCPRDIRTLPRLTPPVKAALSSAVFQFLRVEFPKITGASAAQYAGGRVTMIIPVRHWLPSGWIKRECGIDVWRNSVAVAVYFPRLDKPHNPVGYCNDCAHLTFLAARTLGGWTIWGDQ